MEIFLNYLFFYIFKFICILEHMAAQFLQMHF